MIAVADIKSSSLTLADVWTPPFSNSILRDVFLVLGASVGIALLAQLSIPLAWTPVPITGQTFGILLSGVLLGSKRGGLACFAYLAEGACGLPVFAGGTSGLLPFLGPTAGYLLAFPIAAFLTGTLAERGMDRTVKTSMVPFAIGSAIILLIGSLRLASFVGGIEPALIKGALPFVPGEIVKATLAALLLPSLWRLTKR